MKLQMTNKLTFHVQGPKRHGPRLSGGRSSNLQAGESLVSTVWPLTEFQMGIWEVTIGDLDTQLSECVGDC